MSVRVWRRRVRNSPEMPPVSRRALVLEEVWGSISVPGGGMMPTPEPAARFRGDRSAECQRRVVRRERRPDHADRQAEHCRPADEFLRSMLALGELVDQVVLERPGAERRYSSSRLISSRSMQLLLHVEILTRSACDAPDGRKLRRLFVEYVPHRSAGGSVSQSARCYVTPARCWSRWRGCAHRAATWISDPPPGARRGEGSTARTSWSQRGRLELVRQGCS